ncbi:MAG: DUF305 domain-containing protein, partial [Rubrobacter sp.]|nr:DUF305 domain-containing protein [Rubrobacter sp.]
GNTEQGNTEQGNTEQGNTEQGNMDPGSGGMASEMVMENGEYSDERFIDAMAPHHQGAVEMADVALENAEHPELRQLAGDIVSGQQAEIEQMRAIKERLFGSSEVPMEMSPEEMEMMGMMEDPGQLADEDPFDRAFIDEMTPHHESAIEMARVAQESTNDPEIRELARGIVEAQEAEIEQMTTWREEWYPES